MVSMDVRSTLEMQALQSDIDAEVAEIEDLLKKVTDCCAEFPGEGDTTMTAIEEWGRAVNEGFENLIWSFKEIGKLIAKGIEFIASTVDDMVDTVKSTRTK